MQYVVRKVDNRGRFSVLCYKGHRIVLRPLRLTFQVSRLFFASGIARAKSCLQNKSSFRSHKSFSVDSAPMDNANSHVRSSTNVSALALAGQPPIAAHTLSSQAHPTPQAPTVTLSFGVDGHPLRHALHTVAPPQQSFPTNPNTAITHVHPLGLLSQAPNAAHAHAVSSQILPAHAMPSHSLGVTSTSANHAVALPHQVPPSTVPHPLGVVSPSPNHAQAVHPFGFITPSPNHAQAPSHQIPAPTVQHPLGVVSQNMNSLYFVHSAALQTTPANAMNLHSQPPAFAGGPPSSMVGFGASPPSLNAGNFVAVGPPLNFSPHAWKRIIRSRPMGSSVYDELRTHNLSPFGRHAPQGLLFAAASHEMRRGLLAVPETALFELARRECLSQAAHRQQMLFPAPPPSPPRLSQQSASELDRMISQIGVVQHALPNPQPCGITYSVQHPPTMGHHRVNSTGAPPAVHASPSQILSQKPETLPHDAADHSQPSKPKGANWSSSTKACVSSNTADSKKMSSMNSAATPFVPQSLRKESPPDATVDAVGDSKPPMCHFGDKCREKATCVFAHPGVESSNMVRIKCF